MRLVRLIVVSAVVGLTAPLVLLAAVSNRLSWRRLRRSLANTRRAVDTERDRWRRPYTFAEFLDDLLAAPEKPKSR